ncbi:hypothetical protein EVAR_28630_1 [Eumeta japonica]|uniref:Odorant receptor n=1 Tax=Eumeta variegata TaxID=151549 RepID=A0A4C1XUW9_EUMVA|nr:hypothetical protein EVAR_28630_1 [Eumeta japonica]
MEEATFRAFNFILSWGGVRIFAKNNKRRKLWFSLQIFNFVISLLALVFTCGFVIKNVSDLLLLLRGACIWGTCVILTMTLGIFLVYQKDMKIYLEHLAVDDAILEMPLINYLLQQESFNRGGKLKDLKNLVEQSQEKLSKFTRVLLMSYALVIFVTASLYLCDTIYEMVKRDDKSLRLFAFDMWFPWSVEDFNVYVITFIGHVYAAYLCICAYAGFQTTVILLVGQVVRQVRIMTFILSNLRCLAEEMHSLTGHDSAVYCTSVLIQCVQHFIRLKKADLSSDSNARILSPIVTIRRKSGAADDRRHRCCDNVRDQRLIVLY